MSEPVRYTITIGTDGSVHAETHGVVGEACLAHIPILEKLLDGEVIDSSFTDDYNRNVLMPTVESRVRPTVTDDV